MKSACNVRSTHKLPVSCTSAAAAVHCMLSVFFLIEKYKGVTNIGVFFSFTELSCFKDS